jgi:serine/threonine protein kinase
MSPEAIYQKYSVASDVWSLGVTIWEVVTGLDPSRQMPLPDLAVKIRDEGYHPRIAPVWPTWLQQILVGCWNADPAKRLSLEGIERIAREASISTIGKSDSKYIDVGVLNAKKSRRDLGGGSSKSGGSVADEIAQLRKRLQRLEAETKSLEKEKARLITGDSSPEPTNVDASKKSKKKDKKQSKGQEDGDEAVEMAQFAPGGGGKSAGWRRTVANSDQLTNTYGPVPARPDDTN